jgi:hypothetical protein
MPSCLPAVISLRSIGNRRSRTWINGASSEAVRHRQKPFADRGKAPESAMPSKFRTDGFVILAARAPVLGIVMAIYSKEPAWRFLCFALALFP